MRPATILVVDDEQLIRWSLTSRLHDEGYRVVSKARRADINVPRPRRQR